MILFPLLSILPPSVRHSSSATLEYDVEIQPYTKIETTEVKKLVKWLNTRDMD